MVKTHVDTLNRRSFIMIERNLGNLERLFRLAFGIGFIVWALNQPAMNAVEWGVFTVAIFLILNGVFSRCLLWWAIGLDTHKNKRDILCRYDF